MRQKIETALVLFSLVLGKFLALWRDVRFTAVFGAGVSASAYELVSRVPNLLYELSFGGVLFGLLLPVIGRRRGARAAEGVRLTCRFLLVALPLFVLTAAVAWRFAPQIVVGMTDDWTAGDTAQAVSLFRSLIFTLPLLALIAVCTVYLQANGHLVMPAFAAVMPAVFAVLYLSFVTRSDIYTFALVVVLGIAAESGLLAFYTLALWWHAPHTTSVMPPLLPQICRFLKLSFPVFLVAWTGPVGSFAALFAVGRLAAPEAVAYYGYATRLSVSLTAIFVFCLGSLFFPRLVGERSPRRRLEKIEQMFFLLAFFGLPIVTGAIVLAPAGIDLFYGRGAFSDADVAATAHLLRVALLAVLPALVNEAALKLHYADGNYQRPLMPALTGLVVELLLLPVGGRLWGSRGILLASALGGMVRAIGNLVSLARRGLLPHRRTLRRYGWILLANAAMTVTLLFSDVPLFSQISLAGAVYVGVMGSWYLWQKWHPVYEKNGIFPCKEDEND